MKHKSLLIGRTHFERNSKIAKYQCIIKGMYTRHTNIIPGNLHEASKESEQIRPDIVIMAGQKSSQNIDSKYPQPYIIFNAHDCCNTFIQDGVPWIFVGLCFGCYLQCQGSKTNEFCYRHKFHMKHNILRTQVSMTKFSWNQLFENILRLVVWCFLFIKC